MIRDQNRIFDGWRTLEGGVDAGRQPNLLDQNQVQSAINMTFRGGSATTRPGFREIAEQFPPVARWHGVWLSDQMWCYNRRKFGGVDLRIEGQYKLETDTVFFDSEPPPPPPPAPPPGILPEFENENSEYIYRHGILQCANAYSPHNGDDCIMALVGGRLFKIVPGVKTAPVTEILIEDDPRNLRNMRNRSIAYMTQADKFLIAQDGTGGAIIYDSNKARRAKTTGTEEQTEVPVGTIMAYGMGRIVVCVNERDIAFGDLYGSHVLSDPADSLILFTERNFLAEGFDAAIPFQQGRVTGMSFFAQLDTSTGNGQLMVFAERGSASFFMSIPRDQWKTSAFQVLSLLTTGLRGHRTVSVVNEDLWFRSDDGVRSYRQARSEPSGWAHVPLSTNVKQFLGNDSDFLLKYASSIYFDNRIIFTTSPLWNNGRPYHAGLVVVDFEIISSFSGTAQTPQSSKPAWEGQWKCDRFRPVQLLTGNFKGKTRAFCFGLTDELDDDGNPVLDPDGNPFQVNQLYEISKDDKDDFVNERIPWEFVSKTLDFQSSQESTPFTENEVYDGDMWLREIIE